MYLNLRIGLLGIISLIGTSCNAQKNGYVVTNTNDTIRGKFKLAIYPESSAYGTPLVFAIYNLKNTKTNIYIDSIKKINIIKRKKKSDSYIIFDNDIWQLVAARKNLGIYKRDYETTTTDDNATIYNPVTGNSDAYTTLENTTKYLSIAIFSANIQKAQIYSGLKNASYSDIDKEVLQFINSRYKLRLTSKELHINIRPNFAHQEKLFAFILDKEAELEQQGK